MSDVEAACPHAPNAGATRTAVEDSRLYTFLRYAPARFHQTESSAYAPASVSILFPAIGLPQSGVIP
jgi:hypothetical protein